MPNWDVMESKTRYKHPSRVRFYKFLKKTFGTKPFKFLDVGVISLVDYKRIKKEYPKLDFHYVGVDIHPKIISIAKEEVTDDDDIYTWDIHNPAPEEVGKDYDVALLKHMLNYCKSYNVILNVAAVMKKPGYIFIINNDNVFAKKNKYYKVEKPKVGIGNYGSLFSKKKYLNFLNSHFKNVDHQKLKDWPKRYSITIVKVT